MIKISATLLLGLMMAFSLFHNGDHLIEVSWTSCGLRILMTVVGGRIVYEAAGAF